MASSHGRDREFANILYAHWPKPLGFVEECEFMELLGIARPGLSEP